MKKLLTITLALSLLCATLLFVPASATAEDEIIDWDTVDWENINFDRLNDDELRSLQDWLKNEASAEDLVCATKGNWDGAYATTYRTALGNQFTAEPRLMLAAMSKADADSQELIARFLVDNDAYLLNDIDIVRFLAELQLPADAKAERAMLNKIIDYTEQYYGVDIPRTGDLITMALVALLLSGTGLVLTIRKKRV